MITREWCFLSDLHLDVEPDPRRAGERFAAFLESYLAEDPDRERHLVLLGDLFELAGTGDRPAARLAELAQLHPQVFASLARTVRGGVTLHVVCGNHDLALARPGVWAALLRVLELDGDERRKVRLHPWFLHVPGICYAEHGHQHHELNRSPAMLELTRHAVLPPAPIPAWTGTGGTLWNRVTGVAAAARAVGDEERRAASPAYDHLLQVVAREERLAPYVVRRLHAVSRRGVVRGAAASAGRVARRRAGRPGPDLLARPAAAVSRVLREAGQPVPVVVFGHTHRARVALTPDGTTYANSGTWCSDVRGAGPDALDTGIFPAVRLSDGPTGVRLALQWWSDAADKLRPRLGAGTPTRVQTRRQPCIPPTP